MSSMGMDLYLLLVDDDTSAVWKASTYLDLPRNYELLSLFDWDKSVFGHSQADFIAEKLPPGVQVEFFGELAEGFSPGGRATDPYGTPLAFVRAKIAHEVLSRHPQTMLHRALREARGTLRVASPDAKVILYWC